VSKQAIFSLFRLFAKKLKIQVNPNGGQSANTKKTIIKVATKSQIKIFFGIKDNVLAVCQSLAGGNSPLPIWHPGSLSPLPNNLFSNLP
jgi:hypothetical protein